MQVGTTPSFVSQSHQCVISKLVTIAHANVQNKSCLGKMALGYFFENACSETSYIWPISTDELSINQIPEFTKGLFFHKEVYYQ